MKNNVIGKRFKFVTGCFAAAFLVVIVRIVMLLTDANAINLKDDYINNYEYTTMKINSERGNIYDRAGYLLAGNTISYDVSLNLNLSKIDPDFVAKHLSPILGMPEEDIFKIANYKNLDENKNSKLVQYPVKNYVSKDIIDKIEIEKTKLASRQQSSYEKKTKKLPDLDSVVYTESVHRYYPDNDLAANIIGFYPYKNPEAGASFGIEKYYDDILKAETVSTRYSLNPNITDNYPDLPSGASIVLTIDRNIQKICEDKVDEAQKTSKAKNVSAIIYNPKTGEIIAMATSPRINLNDYWDDLSKFDNDHLYNPPVMQPFEVGSVFKVITMSSAIDLGVVKPETVYNDTGVHMVGESAIYNWNRGAWGPQTMIGCMQHSLNTCLSWVAEQVGTDSFYQYLSAFQLDEPTGIELADENYMPYWKPGSIYWSEYALRANSYGQGLETSAIQLVKAIGAVANKGVMMNPHIVKAIYYNDHSEIIQPSVAGHPISEETAKTITDMLAISIKEESEHKASLDNVQIAGKTGTGEISHGNLGYVGSTTNASFIGWGPTDDPQFVTYVWFQEPQTNMWGSEIASPLFKSIMEDVLPYMHLPTDRERACLYTDVCPTEVPDDTYQTQW